MNIGIIVFSQTGHTYSVAQELEEKLSAAGHSVNVERLEISGVSRPGSTAFQLTTRPEVEPYDALVFGAPVHGGRLPPPMTRYLEQIGSLESKQVACLVTQFFPFPQLGGNQAISQMKGLCESKGATVRGSGIVNWSRLRRKRQIEEVVGRLSGLF